MSFLLAYPAFVASLCLCPSMSYSLVPGAAPFDHLFRAVPGIYLCHLLWSRLSNLPFFTSKQSEESFQQHYQLPVSTDVQNKIPRRPLRVSDDPTIATFSPILPSFLSVYWDINELAYVAGSHLQKTNSRCARMSH